MQETVASLSINHLFNIKYVDSKPLFITSVVREIFHTFRKEIPTNSSSLVSSLLGGSLKHGKTVATFFFFFFFFFCIYKI